MMKAYSPYCCKHRTMKQLRRVAFQRESRPPVQLTSQPPPSLSINTFAVRTWCSFWSCFFHLSSVLTFTFLASYRIQNLECRWFFKFQRELSAIHPSGRRWGSHAAATIPHVVLPSGSARRKGFGPSPEKSSFGNQHDSDFKIVWGFLKINLQIILYGWPSDIDLIFRASHMLSLCCVPGESNLASLV